MHKNLSVALFVFVCLVSRLNLCSMAMSTAHASDAIPSAADTAKAIATIREIYNTDYSTIEAKGSVASKTSEAIKALADTLYQQSRESKVEKALYYTMLKESQRLYLSIGDSAGSLACIKILAQTFDIKEISESLLAIQACKTAARFPAQYSAMIDQLVSLAEASIRENEYVLANQAIQLANSFLPSAETPFLASRLAEMSKRTNSLKQQFGQIAVSLKSLGAMPDDPKANFDVGRYYCLQKGDFEAGLPLLAKGSDKNLKEVAELEISKTEICDEMARLGDEWLKLGQKERMVFWYSKALIKAEGTTKLRIHKVLEDVGYFDKTSSTFGTPQDFRGIKISVYDGDGEAKHTTYMGRPCVSVLGRYLYLRIDSAWAKESNYGGNVEVELEFLSLEDGIIHYDYHTIDKIPDDSRISKVAKFSGGKKWQTKSILFNGIQLVNPDCRSDLRLLLPKHGEFFVFRCEVRRVKGASAK